LIFQNPIRSLFQANETSVWPDLLAGAARIQNFELQGPLQSFLPNSAAMSATTHENDPEKGTTNNGNGKDFGGSHSPDYDAGLHMDAEKQPWNRRFIDSFKRDPNAHVTSSAAMHGGEGFDHKGAAERTANSGLAQKLKARHMQMIAIGGSIGEFRNH
jgi:hypothetical protein